MWRISQWILVWTRRTRVGWEEERKKAAANEKEAAEMGRGCRRWGGLVVKTTASLSYTPLFVLCAEGSVFFNVLAVSGALIVWDTMVLYESQACAWVSLKIKSHVSFDLIIRHNFISGHGHLFDSFPSKASLTGPLGSHVSDDWKLSCVW